MIDFLSYMFQRGNIIDIGWFVAGAWLLLLFLGIMGTKLVRGIRRRISTHSDPKTHRKTDPKI